MKQKEWKNIVCAGTDEGPVWPHSVVLSKRQKHDRCLVKKKKKRLSQNVKNMAVFTRRVASC